MLYNIIIIAHNQHTDIYSLINIHIHIHIQYSIFIQSGMLLSFEILLEETRSGPRTRAVRMRLDYDKPSAGASAYADKKKENKSADTDNKDKNEKSDSSVDVENAATTTTTAALVSLQIGVRGKVTRDSTNKRDIAGCIIPLQDNNSSTTNNQYRYQEKIEHALHCHALHKVCTALEQLKNIVENSKLQELVLDQLGLSEVKLYLEALVGGQEGYVHFHFHF